MRGRGSEGSALLLRVDLRPSSIFAVDDAVAAAAAAPTTDCSARIQRRLTPQLFTVPPKASFSILLLTGNFTGGDGDGDGDTIGGKLPVTSS